MAKGGFKRAVKVVKGKVVDHRPLDHEDIKGDGTWVEVEVPKDIPETLNTLISARVLEHDGQELKVAADYKEKVAELRKPQPSPLDVLLSRVGELEAKVKALEEAKK